MTKTIVNLLDEASKRLVDRYEALYEDAKKDSGSAGDNGEEIWASILREWLPPYFDVKTKAKIINKDGDESPQVDIVVLSPYYPKALKESTVYYLASGVVCAFECKNTLKAQHIEKYFETSRSLSSLIPAYPLPGKVWHVVRPPILYGLLAHSHDWKKDKSKPKENINSRLKIEIEREEFNNPRQLPSILCVADVASWVGFTTLDYKTKTKIVSSMHYYQVFPMADAETEWRYDPLNVFLVDLYSKLSSFYPPMELAATIAGDLRHQTSDKGHQNAYLKAASKEFPANIIPDKLMPFAEEYFSTTF